MLEGQQRAAQQAIAPEAEGVRGQLGLEARAAPADARGAVARDLELPGQLAVDRLDDLAEVVDRPRQRRGRLVPLVAALGRQQDEVVAPGQLVRQRRVIEERPDKRRPAWR